MNILELEEALRNLIATQPAIMAGPNAAVIGGIKNIIEAHKAFCFRVEEYPEQDILKVGVMNESAKLELNLTSYVCQILQERGINIMLYVPKYAAVYNQEISKYVDNVLDEPENIEKSQEPAQPTENNANKEEKYMFVNKQDESSQQLTEQNNKAAQTQSKGRDYLMDLLKK